MPYKDREKRRAQERRWKRRQRKKGIELLGGKCFFCGKDDDVRFIFHRKDGQSHRKWNVAVLVLKNPEEWVLVCAGMCHGATHFCMNHLGMSWEEIEKGVLFKRGEFNLDGYFE